jgi:hypothetical protein
MMDVDILIYYNLHVTDYCDTKKSNMAIIVLLYRDITLKRNMISISLYRCRFLPRLQRETNMADTEFNIRLVFYHIFITSNNMQACLNSISKHFSRYRYQINEQHPIFSEQILDPSLQDTVSAAKNVVSIGLSRSANCEMSSSA